METPSTRATTTRCLSMHGLRCSSARERGKPAKHRNDKMHRRHQRTEDRERARHRRRLANLVARQIAAQALVLATIFVTTGHAENSAAVSQKELRAKMAYCNTCHGPSGQGFRGFDPIPRLA